LKIIRFQSKDEISYGLVDGEKVYTYAETPFDLTFSGNFKLSGQSISTADIRLLPPCQPSKIVCLGLNYRPHSDELKMKLPDLPLLFIKPSTAVIGPDDNIVLPPGSARIDYECELGVVIGKTARNVKESEFAEYVLGYSCFNDVTDRIAQSHDGQWTRSKSHDTFAPLGPCIDTMVEPFNLKIETRLNGKVMQSDYTSNLIFPVPYLVSFISHCMTLLPGDVIATGTPAGIGPLNAGDIVEVIIEKIGTLRNHVVASSK